MSNEEAIKELKEVYNGLEFKYEATTANAFDSAISALESIDRITAERDAFMNDFKKGFEEQVNKQHGIYRCDICKYGGDYYSLDSVGLNCPKDCDGFNHWEWRGVRNEG